MNRIEILKAKIDFHKTWFASSLAALIANQIGYWSFYQKNAIAQTLFFLVSILFAISCWIFLKLYISRHKLLIDELQK